MADPTLSPSTISTPMEWPVSPLPPIQFETTAAPKSHLPPISAALSPAQFQVLHSTVELLEHILSYIPTQDLLLSAPLVCRHWCAVISSSPKLQQKLFFSPVVPGPGSRTTVLELNPLLLTRFKIGWDSLNYWKPPASNNTQIPPSSFQDPQDQDRAAGQILWVSCNPAWSARLFSQKNASWKRMLVTQPPFPYRFRFSGDESDFRDGIAHPPALAPAPPVVSYPRTRAGVRAEGRPTTARNRAPPPQQAGGRRSRRGRGRKSPRASGNFRECGTLPIGHAHEKACWIIDVEADKCARAKEIVGGALAAAHAAQRSREVH